MADRILLLPDNIANQIAAGEVIQRPSSAVKELLENAVDAGATEIKLLINDAGKALIQVIDNGVGMSETDARMAFERHATSKIRSIDDLFQIRTMGFRGEALASIAAVAQVELKTKRAEDVTGTRIEIENSHVIVQEPVASSVGTSITMKNLFFNLPARRNFLKSNTSELRHIIDEFIRVALGFPTIFFSLSNNGQEIFHLEPGNLKQRIVQIIGNNYNPRLIPVKEDTDYLNIYGFIGKPDAAKKTRGDQYFFVNNRFIRSNYLNHALQSAYHDLISSESYPLYFLFIDLDPAQVDVNVHPTKQEIKFEDEKIVYAFVHAAVKHSLAQFSITPTLDFNLDASIQELDSIQKPFTEEKRIETRSSSIFQTFTEANQAHKIESTPLRNWNAEQEMNSTNSFKSLKFLQESLPIQTNETDFIPVQLLQTYILICYFNKFILIHQQSAHERILYERLIQAVNGNPVATQQNLFPVTLETTPSDYVIVNELIPMFQQMGYILEPFGTNTFVIQGTPSIITSGNEKTIIENIIEQYKNFSSDIKISRHELLIRSIALQQAIKPGVALTETEMKSLVNDLFSCSQPNYSPTGKPVFLEFGKEQLEIMFGR
ncbi:MAG TPA: DNA mismatch repair endonuclease MutL [Flavisolibacter sp.]|nr:DNA mismatch repair endonuclease MutL [Flavisolibacter sp.]